MGFEQLAELKRQLVAQAEQEKRQTRKPSARSGGKPAQARKPSTRTGGKPAQEAPVDPVVITISRLQKQFPLAFPKKPAPKLPLKLGIHKDLYAQAESLKLTNAEIKEAVKTWCQGSRYWACMVEGAARLDLAGVPAGEVTATDATHAQQLAERRRTHAHRARKKAAQKSDEAPQDGARKPTDSAPANISGASVEPSNAPVKPNDVIAEPGAASHTETTP